MKTFFDSSAFAKRYIEEKGSQLVDDICYKATEVCLSVICVPEIISALNRRLREKSLSNHDYLTIKQHLSDDIRDAVIVTIPPAKPEACICEPLKAVNYIGHLKGGTTLLKQIQLV